MKQLLLYIMLVLSMTYGVTLHAKGTEFTFTGADVNYHYTVVQTGENYTFKFAQPVNDSVVKLQAGYHVLQSVYQDSSIYKQYTEAYIRERARCYVFDSRFYTYSLCFLPNDFNIKYKDRFWGFTTQVPNWKWLATRFLLPTLFAFALFFYVANRQYK